MPTPNIDTAIREQLEAVERELVIAGAMGASLSLSDTETKRLLWSFQCDAPTDQLPPNLAELHRTIKEITAEAVLYAAAAVRKAASAPACTREH